MARTKNSDINQHLVKALAAIDAQINELQAQRNQLASIIGSAGKVKVASSDKPKRPMSEEARKKISLAQKKKWAERKKKNQPAAAKVSKAK